jgi:hypothetical protein
VTHRFSASSTIAARSSSTSSNSQARCARSRPARSPDRASSAIRPALDLCRPHRAPDRAPQPFLRPLSASPEPRNSGGRIRTCDLWVMSPLRTLRRTTSYEGSSEIHEFRLALRSAGLRAAPCPISCPDDIRQSPRRVIMPAVPRSHPRDAKCLGDLARFMISAARSHPCVPFRTRRPSKAGCLTGSS